MAERPMLDLKSVTKKKTPKTKILLLACEPEIDFNYDHFCIDKIILSLSISHDVPANESYLCWKKDVICGFDRMLAVALLVDHLLTQENKEKIKRKFEKIDLDSCRLRDFKFSFHSNYEDRKEEVKIAESAENLKNQDFSFIGLNPVTSSRDFGSKWRKKEVKTAERAENFKNQKFSLTGLNPIISSRDFGPRKILSHVSTSRGINDAKINLRV